VLAGELQSTRRNGERRSKPRIDVPFQVKVEGVDEKGEKFTIETVLDNVSSNGLYLRMMPHVEKGAKLSIVLGLHTPSQPIDEIPRFVMEAIVLRTEKKVGGVYGVAATFDQVRFL
jgi:hypothetical protein